MTNNLKAILHYEEMSIKELGIGLGISYTSILSNVSGAHIPNVYIALKIANYLGYTVEEIWGTECPAEIIEEWKYHKAADVRKG